MTFADKWTEAVKKKNSILCAGLDPAEFGMGRSLGLRSGQDKKRWALDYIKAVAPYCAGLKPNLQYWKAPGDMSAIKEIVDYAHSLGMVVIDDSKISDIGSTNDAGFYYSTIKDFDAITIAPFPGNIEESIAQAKKRDIGVIPLCIMSNPEFEKIKNSWICGDDFYSDDIIMIQGRPHVKYFLYIAKNCSKADGVVIGAPSGKNHITESDIAKVKSYLKPETLILIPGVGAQGGEIGIFLNYFRKENLIINVGRSVMFPDGVDSTPKAQEAAAKKYLQMINDQSPQE